MRINYQTVIEGHSFWLRSCGTGSIDPWCMDYISEHNIPVLATADMTQFVMVDGDELYTIYNFKAQEFADSNFQTYDAAMNWINSHCLKFGSYKDNLASYKKRG